MSVAQPENVYSSEAITVVIAASLQFQQKVIDIFFGARLAGKKPAASSPRQTTSRMMAPAWQNGDQSSQNYPIKHDISIGRYTCKKPRTIHFSKENRRKKRGEMNNCLGDRK
jgi:hypothetical protein